MAVTTDQPPYASYAAIMATFAGGLAVATHSGDEELVESGGLDQAIGELVTCSRCVGTWAAAGLTVTQILAPRFGRLLAWSLGAAAANDFLQAGFAALTAKANSLEQQS